MKHQFLCQAVISAIIMSAKYSITKLHDLIKLLRAMVCEVEGYYRLDSLSENTTSKRMFERAALS